MVRISLGQSFCGGSVDAHVRDDGSLHGQWCVEGAAEWPDTQEGWTAARALASKYPGAYPYRMGEWAPPAGAARLSQYSPREH